MPDIRDVREAYQYGAGELPSYHSANYGAIWRERGAEFDMWLAERDREVAAKALHEAAHAIPDVLPLSGGGLSIDYGGSRAAWLHARADGVSAGAEPVPAQDPMPWRSNTGVRFATQGEYGDRVFAPRDLADQPQNGDPK